MKCKIARNPLSYLIGGILLTMTTDVLASTVFSQPTAVVTGHAPTLTAGQITYEDKNGDHVLSEGDVVKIDSAHPFVFSDSDGDRAAANTYSWKVNGKQVATTETYTIRADDAGKKIQLEVTPHTNPNSSLPADGTAVAATAELQVAANDDVISVAITGKPVVNETLTAVPTCTKACGNVKYQWQLEDKAGSNKFVDYPSTTNTLKVTPQMQRLKVRVTATNGK
ncbi:ZirU family protein [Siccibacter turicensis]|uniref:ZirU family protein n=1 Tax=Siccibacter turicensis TaxID=357233 RepID=UPI0010220298|nr:ZirU family protein [Siccibacter turicensis]